jgi:hypothetical protein
MEELKIRHITDKDHSEILSKWWNDWGFNPVPLDFLPKTGWVALYGDRPILAAYMYTTDSKVAWLSWFISDKNFGDRGVRNEAIKKMLMIAEITADARGRNFMYVNFGAENTSNIQNVCEQTGFKKGTITQEMIKSWD